MCMITQCLCLLLCRKAGDTEANEFKTVFPVICILDGGEEKINISRARLRDQISLSHPEHNTARADLEELCQAALAHTSQCDFLFSLTILITINN